MTVVSKLDLDLVKLNTKEAQEYRISQIAGKKILWVTCYYTADFYESLKPLIQNLKTDHGAEIYVLLDYNARGDFKMAQRCLNDGIISDISKQVIFADFKDTTFLTNNLITAVQTKFNVKNDINYDFMREHLRDNDFVKTLTPEKNALLAHYNSPNFEVSVEVQKRFQDDSEAVENMVITAAASGAEVTQLQRLTIDKKTRPEITFDAVFSPHEVSQPTVSELARSLSLPGNDPIAYYRARNKFLARERLSGLSVAQCKYMKVNCEEDLVDIDAKVGYPLVLKPVVGAASEGVYKCYNHEDVVTNMRRVFQSIDNRNMTLIYNPGTENNFVPTTTTSSTSATASTIENELKDQNSSTDELAVGTHARQGIHFILEQYLSGDEFDVDILMYDGEVVFTGAIDNWETQEPYFLETGSNCPSKYPTDKLKILYDYAISCVKGLGFKQGCFHVEVKYTVDGPILIEVNARMGGGRTRLFYDLVYGVDLFINFFLSALGIPIRPHAASEPQCCLLDYFICCPVTGKLMNYDFLNPAKEHPAVLKTASYCEVGSDVRGYDKGIPQWLGDFQVRCPTYAEAKQAFATIIAKVHPENSIVPESTQAKAKAGRSKQRARASSISQNARISFSRSDVLP